MKNSEAIRILEGTTLCTPLGQAAFVGIEAIKKLQQYQTIGTVEECFYAKNLQIVKKPDVFGDGYDNDGNIIYDSFICPNCKKIYEIDYDYYKYCPNCGQNIGGYEE